MCTYLFGVGSIFKDIGCILFTHMYLFNNILAGLPGFRCNTMAYICIYVKGAFFKKTGSFVHIYLSNALSQRPNCSSSPKSIENFSGLLQPFFGHILWDKTNWAFIIHQSA
jgi:hypothetical protein